MGEVRVGEVCVDEVCVGEVCVVRCEVCGGEVWWVGSVRS